MASATLVGLINEKGEHYQLKYDKKERLIEEIGFDGEPELKRKIVDYLSSGKILFAFLEVFECKFGCPLNEPVIYNRSLTDGVWVWPYELIHYVSDHDIDLPKDFIEHINANKFNLHIEKDVLEIISEINISFPSNNLCEVSYKVWDSWLKEKGEEEFLLRKSLGLKRKKPTSSKAGDVNIIDLL